jgi:type III protein arginine methyltransferase
MPELKAQSVAAEMTGAQFEALVVAAQGRALPLALLAENAWSSGRDRARAVALAMEAEALATDDAEVRSITRFIITSSIPDWHFDIVRDKPRNAAFEAALLRAIKPESRILDIGSGTGLLAMIAARAGAEHVFTCEMNPVVADASSRIVAANGFDGVVHLLQKHSMSIDPVADMGGQADIIVSEIVGNDLVCEGVLPSLNDAAKRLLKPGGRMIPQAGQVMVALAHWANIGKHQMRDVSGFDMREFNCLRPAWTRLAVGDPALKLHGTGHALFRFDFHEPAQARPRSQIDLTADGQPINGIVQWIRLDLDDEIKLENRPGPDARSSWACVFFPLAEEIRPEAGATVRVYGAHSANKLRIWTE